MISRTSPVRAALRLIACAALAVGFASGAHAALVSTGDTAEAERAAAARQQIKALAERPELSEKLTALGVAPDQAQSRVDAMTDAEVLSLANKLGELPAGGRGSNDLVVILLLIIILVILI